ncbi:hypothetical protein Agub_g11392, partial [Astrephomene gubernaculifera]
QSKTYETLAKLLPNPIMLSSLAPCPTSVIARARKTPSRTRCIASTGCTAATCNAGSEAREEIALERARAYYQDVWSEGRVLRLNAIMAEDHQQHDMIWQPHRVGAGRRAMKRGIIAYRRAYPDLVFQVYDMSYS